MACTMDASAIMNRFMEQAIELAAASVRTNSGPFAALVVKDGNVVAIGVNQVVRANDPTAHAEIVAIREACRALGDFQLAGCDVYASCEPCPMCLGATYRTSAPAGRSRNGSTSRTRRSTEACMSPGPLLGFSSAAETLSLASKPLPQPLMQVFRDKRVIVQMRVSLADPVDLFHLAGGEVLARVQTPAALQ